MIICIKAQKGPDGLPMQPPEDHASVVRCYPEYAIALVKTDDTSVIVRFEDGSAGEAYDAVIVGNFRINPTKRLEASDD